MKKPWHPVQERILRDLLLESSAQYSRIKPLNMEGSKFTFHIQKLVESGYVRKNADGTYSLTQTGKDEANRFDPHSENPLKQAKVSVIVCPTRNDRADVLVYNRLKNPYLNCQGFQTGKVQHGESIEDAARRNLKEETSLNGNPEYLGTRHYRVRSKDGILLEDKIMFVMEIQNPDGKLQSDEKGEFEWVPVNKINEFVKSPLPEFQEILELVTHSDGVPTLLEKELVTHFY